MRRNSAEVIHDFYLACSRRLISIYIKDMMDFMDIMDIMDIFVVMDKVFDAIMVCRCRFFHEIENACISFRPFL